MLKFIAISGTTSVTQNLYLYEYGDEMMIVDCGVGFPDLEMPGVDLVLPDFSYIVKNKHKLRGVVVSQGHDDHVGALPFLLREINTPIWCPPIVTEFLKVKFKDYKIKNFTLNTFDPDGEGFSVGPFKIHPFRVSHSVPDTVGFAIDTPEGRTFHVAEHKVDQNSVDGMNFDTQKAKKLAEEQSVLCLMSDCLGANHPGYTPSGTEIENNIYNIVKDAKQAVFMSAISSSIGRFQQMINVAGKVGRKVVFVGRSIQSKTEIAHDLGYLKYPPNIIVDLKESANLRPNQIVYIIAGCYGQEGSSVYRLALGEHDRVKAFPGDTFVFSADPGPAYSKESIDFVVDLLFDQGLDVHYYDLHEGLHVSGHGGQEDIKDLFKIVKPKYFVPIGGEVRYMHSYEKLVHEFEGRRENVYKLHPGESIILEKGEVRRGETIKTKEVLVHGLGIGDVGKVVLGDREVLGTEGFVVVVLKINKGGGLVGSPEIITRGFVYEGISANLLSDAGGRLQGEIRKRGSLRRKGIKEEITNFLEKHFYKITGRSPMVLPVIVEV